MNDERKDEKMRATEPASVLPSDGTIIRVSDWRRKLLWSCAAGFAVVGFSVIVSAIQVGRPLAIVPALFAVGVIFTSVRMPLSGVVLEQTGVKARGLWRTYRWRWDEIERFELRERGEPPRFRIHLRDGRTKGFSGFFARSPEQEERGQALFKALEKRLEDETGEMGGRSG